MIQPWVSACSVALLLTSTAVAQEPTYRLELTDDIGATSRYHVVFQIEMHAEYPGPAADERAKQLMEALQSGMELRTAMEFEQRLTDVAEDGTRTFLVRWHDYQFGGTVGERAIPEPPGHDRAVEALLNSSATMRTTPSGRTLSVSYSGTELQALSESLQQLNRSMPTYLPERPVKVGDGWKSVTDFPTALAPGGAGLKMSLELEHTLEEVRQGPDGPIAVVSLRGSYSRLQGVESSTVTAPMHVQLEMTGSTRFHIEDGRFTDGDYQLDMLAVQNVKGVDLEIAGHANGRLELVKAQ